MPRIAAALAVLVAVTFSIGFNISRYPVVWAMLGPAPPLASQDARLPADLQPSPAAAVEELPVAPTTPPDPCPAASLPLANRMPEPIAVCESDVPPQPTPPKDVSKPKRQKQGKAPEGYRVECDGDSCRLVAEQPSDRPPDESSDQPQSPAPTAKAEEVAKDTDKPPAEDAGPAAVAPAAKYASVAAADPAGAIQCEKPLVPVAKSEVAEPEVAASTASLPDAAEAPPAADPAPLVRRLPPVDSEWSEPGGDVPPPDGPIPLYATTPVP